MSKKDIRAGYAENTLQLMCCLKRNASGLNTLPFSRHFLMEP